MPADVLREREDTPDTPDTGGRYVVAPQFADLADASLTGQLQQNLRDTAVTRRRYEEKADAEEAAMRKSGEAQKPFFDEAQKALAAPHPTPPAPPEIPPPPSRKLTDFFAPVAGESPENTITKLIQGVSIMASGIVGLRRGDATAALASLHGALKGWQEGDKERADRAFSDWEEKSKSVVNDWTRRHQVYRDALEDNNLTVDQKVEAARLKAIEEGHDVAVATFQRKRIQDDLDFLQQDRAQLDRFIMERDRLAEQRRFKDLQLEGQAQMRALTAQHWADQAASRERDRRAQEQNRLDLAAARTDAKKSQKAHGKYYDFANGEPREISLGQWEENNERINRGEKPQFRSLTEAQVQLVERLAVAPPILDRIDQLIDKINREAPGENITQGLINKLKAKAGISADIQELITLNLDTSLEIAAALSGGQPRISILSMIRGEATPTLSMTADVAHRTVQTGRTTIANRLQSTTGDPDAYNKVSKGLTQYGEKKPMQIDLGDGVKLKRLD